MQFLFILCQVEGYRNILKLSCKPIAIASYKDFLQYKKGLELITLPHFLYDFWRKIFLSLHSINWSNFSVWLLLTFAILGNISIAIVCWSGCDIINFEINFIFPIKPFFVCDQNVETKIQRTWERKQFLRRNKNYFSSFSKSSLKQIKQIFLEDEGPTLKILSLA